MHQLISFNIAWQDYQSFNDNFKIKFPDKPEVQKDTQENIYTIDFSDQGLLTMTFSVVEKINPNFMRMNTESLAKMGLFTIQSSFSKALGFSVRSTKYMTYNGYRALETLFNVNKGEMLTHARFILVHDRLYILTVLAKPNTEDLDSIQKFMNSFLILK
jgi:hypothetical protein